MELEEIMLSKRSQKEKDKYWKGVTYIWNIEIQNKGSDKAKLTNLGKLIVKPWLSEGRESKK